MEHKGGFSNAEMGRKPVEDLVCDDHPENAIDIYDCLDS